MQISFRLAALAAVAAVIPISGWAQASRTLNGQWKGTVKDPAGKNDSQIVVDLTKTPKGDWIGTFGMPELGITGMPLANLVVKEPSISFTVPDLPFKPVASFNGKLSDDGRLSGTFDAGGPHPVAFKRAGAANVALPAANSTMAKGFEGAWWGTYDPGGTTLFHLILKLSRKPDGTASGTLTNIDGGNTETPISAIVQAGDFLQFEVRALAGTFRGKLEAGGAEIKGEWLQPNSTPLTFKRGASVNSVNSILPKNFEGSWQGIVDFGKDLDSGADNKVDFVLKLARAADGTATGTLSNKEANSKELPISIILIKGNNLQFEVGLVKGSYHGTINPLGAAIAGAWDQESIMTAPLTFKRGNTPAKK